jgi:hypothetical protein
LAFLALERISRDLEVRSKAAPLQLNLAPTKPSWLLDSGSRLLLLELLELLFSSWSIF